VLYRADLVAPHGARRLVSSLNQRIFERGITPPWVWSRDACQEYWRSQENRPDAPNRPSSYAEKPTEIVDFLANFWSPEVGQADSILELGCNAGANLDRLRTLGYSQLAGIEINPAAIEEMRRSFPALAELATVSRGTFEEMLPALETSSVDVVFTMAVLLHVHPSSHAIFREMARVSRKYICVVEAESTTISYIFARNYRRVFEPLGWPQLKSVMITQPAFPHIGADYRGYTARLFRSSNR
jgi:SAM-dependent methyltransferase